MSNNLNPTNKSFLKGDKRTAEQQYGDGKKRFLHGDKRTDPQKDADRKHSETMRKYAGGKLD